MPPRPPSCRSETACPAASVRSSDSSRPHRLTIERTRATRPLRSARITRLHPYYETVPPPAPLPRHYQAPPLLGDGPPACPASVLSPSQFPLLGVLPLADHSNTQSALSGRGVPTFHTSA